MPGKFESATTYYQRDASSGVQLYEEVTQDQPETDPVGRNVQHLSAEKQVTGEAIYCDDMPRIESE